MRLSSKTTADPQPPRPNRRTPAFPAFRASLVALALALAATARVIANEADQNGGFKWSESFFDTPHGAATAAGPILQVVTQEYQPAQRNESAFKTKLCIGGQSYEHGIGVHADSFIRIKSEQPLSTLSAWIGVDDGTARLGSNRGNVIFSVRAGGTEVYRSPPVHSGAPAIHITVPLSGAKLVELRVTNNHENPRMNYADWAEAGVTPEAAGGITRLDQVEWGRSPCGPATIPSPSPTPANRATSCSRDGRMRKNGTAPTRTGKR